MKNTFSLELGGLEAWLLPARAGAHADALGVPWNAINFFANFKP